MNNKFKAPMMILVAAIALAGVGCGNNKMAVAESTAVANSSDNSGTGTIPTSPDGSSTGTDGSTSYSNEATFTPVSINELNNYVGTRPVNNPTNFKLKIQLAQVGSTGKYAGTVSLSYTDTGTLYTGTFTAGNGKNSSYSGLKDNGTYEAEYNRWFTSGGKTVFSGFFQDQWGGVVLVVDNVVSQGDAQGGTIVTGSLYYKNFAQSYAQQSPYRRCWFIYDGPYNCRSGSVINKSSVIPNDGYIKLGTFSGVSKAAAFQ